MNKTEIMSLLSMSGATNAADNDDSNQDVDIKGVLEPVLSAITALEEKVAQLSAVKIGDNESDNDSGDNNPDEQVIPGVIDDESATILSNIGVEKQELESVGLPQDKLDAVIKIVKDSQLSAMGIGDEEPEDSKNETERPDPRYVGTL